MFEKRLAIRLVIFWAALAVVIALCFDFSTADEKLPFAVDEQVKFPQFATTREDGVEEMQKLWATWTLTGYFCTATLLGQGGNAVILDSVEYVPNKWMLYTVAYEFPVKVVAMKLDRLEVTSGPFKGALIVRVDAFDLRGKGEGDE